MKQRINLCIARQVKHKDSLDLGSAALCLLLILIITATVGWGLHYYQDQQQSLLVELQRTEGSLQRRVSELELKIQSQVPDAQLLRQAQSVRDEIGVKQKLIELIGRSGFTGKQGFSDYLLGLAQAVRPGIALTELSINTRQHEVIVKGRTRSAEEVPLLLRDMGSTAAFRNLLVGDFTLVEMESRHEFSLQTFVQRD